MIVFLSIILLPSITLSVDQRSYSNDECPKNLTWRRISYVENSPTVSLEVCCNVTTVTSVQVLRDWRLNDPPSIDHQSIDDLVLPGFEMQISVCADGTVTPGSVLRSDCRNEIGKVLQLGYDHIDRFDQWYITCFDSHSRPRSSCPTRFCSLDRYCTNTVRCDKVWMTREIVNTTQTHMIILIKVGNILEGTEISLEVDEMTPINFYTSSSYMYQRRQSLAGDTPNQESIKNFYKTTATAPNGQDLIYEVTNLKSEKYYIVRTCAKIRVPSRFFQRYSDYPIAKENNYCLEDAVYTPARYRYNFGIRNMSNNYIVISLIYMLVLFG